MKANLIIFFLLVSSYVLAVEKTNHMELIDKFSTIAIDYIKKDKDSKDRELVIKYIGSMYYAPTLKIKEKLKNKKCWVVYFTQKELMPGGGITILIDESTEKILFVEKWK